MKQGTRDTLSPKNRGKTARLLSAGYIALGLPVRHSYFEVLIATPSFRVIAPVFANK
jgi:hypothetical protein